MIYGRNSWKGFILLLYVVITLCAAAGCVETQLRFYYVVAILLLVCNGAAVWYAYRKLNQDA